MTRRNAAVAVLLAAALVLAGCAGGTGGDPAGSTPDDGLSADGTGTVQFYVSDAPNAIDDFEHLNVTVTAVGLHRVGKDDTPVPASAEAPNGTPATETEAGDDEADDEEEGWVEYEVNRTVDLTELVGDNATELGVLAAPAGTYDKVFVYVSDVDATLENGESVNVKLPSSKLQLNKQFTVGDGDNVSFVFDISVFEAGNSGKYILKPVVSESGAEQEVRDVDDEREDDEADEEMGELTAEFLGRVAPGEEVTVKVTDDDGPVAGATVSVNDERAGTTDDAGELTVTVPDGADEVTVTVEAGDRDAELEREFGDEASLVPVAA